VDPEIHLALFATLDKRPFKYHYQVLNHGDQLELTSTGASITDLTNANSKQNNPM
jgi:hypothetical protein